MTASLLFVDDEPDFEVLIRQKYRQEVRKGSISIDFASRARLALERIDARRGAGEPDYDLVVTDINMPEMSGLALLDELLPRGVMAVVISAYGDMGNLRAAMNRGAFDFLTKPVDFRDLDETIERARRHRASLRGHARPQPEPHAEAPSETPSPPPSEAGASPRSAAALDVRDHLATIGLMTAGLAHDIRNPLGFIVNFGELALGFIEDLSASIAEHVDPEVAVELEADLRTIEENLTKINEHGGRADALVRAMVEVGTAASGDRPSVDLNATVSRQLAMFDGSLRAAEPTLGLELQTELDEAVGRVGASAMDIGRILLNLVQNARDAACTEAPSGRGGGPPRVIVRTVALDDTVQLRVRDNGPGIPPEIEQSIFEPLFTTKGSRGGLGLGLASVRALVERLGGTIEVCTEPGAFAEIIVTLPRAAD